MNGFAVSRDSSRISERVDLRVDDRRAAFEGSQRRTRRFEDRNLRLVAAGLLLQTRDRLLDGLDVGQDQLGLDGADVGGGVDLAVDVRDVLVAEDARDLADRRGLADVREELVAQALSLRGTRDDAGDVDELDGRGQQLGRAEHLGELREPVVGDPDDADVGLDRRERVVRREHVVLGQGVEEGRLARIGESDDTDGESHGPGVYGRAGGLSDSPPGDGSTRPARGRTPSPPRRPAGEARPVRPPRSRLPRRPSRTRSPG